MSKYTDQYVVYGYWDTGYCVGDVTATEANGSINCVASVTVLGSKVQSANASITANATIDIISTRVRDFSGSISASATITASNLFPISS